MANSPPPDREVGDRRRVILLVLLCTTCVAVAGGYVAWAVWRDRSPAAVRGGPLRPGDASAQLDTSTGATVVFRNLAPEPEYGYRVAMVPVVAPEGTRRMAPLACDRIHVAGRLGLCLAEDGGTRAGSDGDVFATHAAYIIGSDFQIRHEVSLGGIPSRARISPDGRYGATTMFVSGHSYTDAGFSTETTLLDLATGASLGNLEEFVVVRDGVRFQAIDFNFWGVTFTADGERFYATLASGGRTHLVEGAIATRTMRTLRENVECPSLSPDGTRLAFKKRVGGLLRPIWRFHVLELATMSETPLAEARSIDDQVEWLDDRQVLYGDGSSVWVMPADGSGQPRKFLSQADSPAVLRDGSAMAASGFAGAPGAAAATLTLSPTDLGVAVATSADVQTGDDLTYTIIVTNHGPVDATSLKVEVVLTAGATIDTPTTALPSAQSYGCAVYGEESRLACDATMLPSGGTWRIAFTARTATVGMLNGQVMVSSAEPDPNPRNDSARTATRVVGR